MKALYFAGYMFFLWPLDDAWLAAKQVHKIPESNDGDRIGQAKTLILVLVKGLIHDIGYQCLKKLFSRWFPFFWPFNP